MFAISSCEVCDSNTLISVLDLGDQPMCDDLVPIGVDAWPKRYPLKLAACPTCLTVHQRYQVEKTLLFPHSYHYRGGMTQDVLAGMADLVSLARRLNRGSLIGSVVLDIGCNDGSLLEKFRAEGALTIGIEPTDAARDAVNRADHVISDFFTDATVAGYLEKYPRPDIITFTNVFAHIEDLNGLIANLLAIAKSATRIIIENHYLGSVLDKFQFDTFYHEHPRTYSQRSFIWIARKLDRKIEHVDFPQRYNGNIRVVLSKENSDPSPGIRNEDSFIGAFESMESHIRNFRDGMNERLAGLVKKHGPLPSKAFPGRAAVIMSYFGIDEKTIGVNYERTGSFKVGHYIPGTRIPILDEALLFRNPDYPVVINLAWHIKNEIHRYMRDKGYNGEIVEIFS